MFTDPSTTGSGLSPRVRGNRLPELGCGRGLGSIPACAGEPWQWDSVCYLHRVYPRVCGGTKARIASRMCSQGLSPRVRGNPVALSALVDHRGSIPACAGEPRRSPRCQRTRGVYPRVCGGTRCGAVRSPGVSGLSPRVRGNQHLQRAARQRPGSIPACAGEPGRWAGCPSMTRVYPRVCGGTRRRFQAWGGYPGLSPRVRGNRLARQRHDVLVGSIPACAGEPPRAWPRSSSRRVYPRVCGGTWG